MVDVNTRILEHRAVFLFNAKVKEVVSQACADEKLHGHIINFLLLLAGAALLKNAVLLDKQLAHDRAQRTVCFLLGRILKRAAEQTAQRVLHCRLGINDTLGTGIFKALICFLHSWVASCGLSMICFAAPCRAAYIRWQVPASSGQAPYRAWQGHSILRGRRSKGRPRGRSRRGSRRHYSSGR